LKKFFISCKGTPPPVNTITKDDDQQLELANEKRDRLLKQVQADDLTSKF